MRAILNSHHPGFGNASRHILAIRLAKAIMVRVGGLPLDLGNNVASAT